MNRGWLRWSGIALALCIGITSVYYGFDIPDEEDLTRYLSEKGLFWYFVLFTVSYVFIIQGFRWKGDSVMIKDELNLLRNQIHNISKISIGYASNSPLIKENKEGWQTILEAYRKVNPAAPTLTQNKKSYVVVAIQMHNRRPQFFLFNRFGFAISKKVAAFEEFASEHGIECVDYRIGSNPTRLILIAIAGLLVIVGLLVSLNVFFGIETL